MARRADHSKAEFETLVVDAAEDLIAREGIDRFSARALSAAVGYTAGSLYHHFKDLDDIVTRVNARTLVGLAHAFNDAATSDDPRVSLHAYADAFLGYIAVKRHLWNALFEFRRAPDNVVPDWYVEAIASLIRILALCFQQLRPDLPRDDALASSQLLFASIHAVVSLESSGRLALVMNRDIGKVAHDLVDMHILAFTNRPA